MGEQDHRNETRRALLRDTIERRLAGEEEPDIDPPGDELQPQDPPPAAPRETAGGGG